MELHPYRQACDREIVNVLSLWQRTDRPICLRQLRCVIPLMHRVAKMVT